MKENMESAPQKDGLPPDAMAWLSDHPDVDVDEIEQMWRLSEHATDSLDVDKVRIEQMRSRIAAQASSGSRSNVIPFFNLRSLGVAASVTVILLIGAGLWLRPVSVSTGTGEMTSFSLPDGSVVRVNSGSTVSYRRTFGWFSRSVDLDGEAFFDVEKADTDFEVNVFNGSVRVLGTRFNVRSRADESDPQTEVFVEEGLVSVASTAHPGEPVTLQAGQRSTIRGMNAPSTPVDVTRQTPSIWRDGGLFFSSRPIGSLLAEIERRFGVEVTVTPDTLANARISLYLSSVDDVGTILEVVSAVHGLQVDPSENGFRLSR